MAAQDVMEMELHVSRVRVEGLRRTKSDIVAEQIKDLLSVTTFVELLRKSDEAANRLKQLNIFKYVDVIWDTAKSNKEGKGGGRGGGVVSADDGLEVTFVVKERGRVSSSIGAEAGTQSGGANLTFTLRNLLGRAENLQLASSTSFPHWGHTLELLFTKPYYKDLSTRFLLSLGTVDNKVPACGYQEHITGTSAEVHFHSPIGRHNLSLGYNCRQLYGFTYNVPMATREEAGYSVKSSIKHILDLDLRDDPSLPRNGRRVKMTHEVAGLGGDVYFSKVDMLSESFLQIYKDWVLSCSLWGGYLHAFTPSKINDRFLLGGASTLRGFGLWGAGPGERGFRFGGEAYWAAGLHLFGPLPLLPSNGLFERIRLHTFATAGSILRTASLSSSMLSSLANDVRLSVGVGLHFRLHLAQIELNYAIPIRARPTDQVQPGIQFGIGLDML